MCDQGWATTKPDLMRLLESSRTKWNGEDIVLSMFVKHVSRISHFLWPLKIQELPSPNAISQQSDHMPHRSALVQLMSKLLA